MELNGHIDTFPLEHAEPAIRDGSFTGRGATGIQITRSMPCGTKLLAFCRRVEVETGTILNVDFRKMRNGFRCADDAPLVRAVQDVYSEVTGKGLPLAGMRIVGDASVFFSETGVPALYLDRTASVTMGILNRLRWPNWNAPRG